MSDLKTKEDCDNYKKEIYQKLIKLFKELPGEQEIEKEEDSPHSVLQIWKVKGEAFVVKTKIQPPNSAQGVWGDKDGRGRYEKLFVSIWSENMMVRSFPLPWEMNSKDYDALVLKMAQAVLQGFVIESNQKLKKAEKEKQYKETKEYFESKMTQRIQQILKSKFPNFKIIAMEKEILLGGAFSIEEYDLFIKILDSFFVPAIPSIDGAVDPYEA